MSMPFRRPVGTMLDFGQNGPTRPPVPGGDGLGTPTPMPRGGPPGDPRDTLSSLTSMQPTAYDAAFEYAARRKYIEELLSNLRPATAGSHLLYGATNVR